MFKDDLTEDEKKKLEKIILEGRIYPAIKACVNNRYKIILGIFAYYSFIISAKSSLTGASQYINLYAGIFFTFFILHNCYNYKINNDEEFEYEHRKDKGTPCIEILFGLFALLLVWGAYFSIK